MIKSFYEISDNEYFQRLENKLRDEIHNESMDYVLSLDENKYKSNLIDKYRLEKIEIFKSEERSAEPQKKIDTITEKYGRSIKRSIYHFTVKYPFSGDPSLFSVRPSQHSIEYKPIEVDTENNTVSINFKLHKNDQDQFEKEKEIIYEQAFINLNSLNDSVEKWNSLLPQKVDSIFEDIKKKYVKENEQDKETNTKADVKEKTAPIDPSVEDIKEKSTEEIKQDKKANIEAEEKEESVPVDPPAEDIKEKSTEEIKQDKKANIEADAKEKPAPVDPPVEDIKKKGTEKIKQDKKANIEVDEKTKSVFAVPLVKEKIMPNPSIGKGEKVAPDPHLSEELYNDILNIIYDVGKKMEKKPSLYLDKDEEDLRDQFLLFLETRYEGPTETGEIFNKNGSTDIILKYSEDGSNLFVAECKFWHGIKVFKKAINQLFDRYLTWRDSKVALLFFVTNNNFSPVLAEVRQHISEHPYYKTYLGDKGDSSFAYKFHLPNHDDIEIDLEVMLFHFPHLD